MFVRNIYVLFFNRRHSKEFVQRREDARRSGNIYSGSPRQSENVVSGVYDEEVYNELDEKQMVDNIGYLDPVPYDEIGEVNLRSDNSARYINESIPRTNSEDYLTPEYAKGNGPRHSSDDYLNAGGLDNPGFEQNGRPQSSDYLKPNDPSIQNGRPDSGDYLKPGKHNSYNC